MRIGLDVMGGDYAPVAVMEGAIEALPHLSDDERIVLIGDETVVSRWFSEKGADLSLFDMVHASEIISMSEHPAKSYSRKGDSSIAVGFRLLKNRDIDGFASAGNTGAMLVGASYTVNVIPGVFRPALATLLPATDGRNSVILDVGLNPDSKPDVLVQYAKLGTIYAKYVLHIDNPTVGLLNIGIEESKGSIAVKSAYELIKDNRSFNFSGNIEANDLFTDRMTDVIVCDGFVGNIVIKQAEAFHSIFHSRGMQDEFFERLNFENIGGTPVIGVNANVVIGHGISQKKAIMNMILQTRDVIKGDLAMKIVDEI